MKVLKTALLFLMCVSFSFSCKEGVKEVRVLKLAHGLPPSHSVHLGLLYMNERLKELSGGKMSMDIYSSAQLGTMPGSVWPPPMKQRKLSRYHESFLRCVGRICRSV